MEFIGGLQSHLFFYSQGAGGWNAVLVILFFIAPPALFFLTGLLFRLVRPHNGREERKDAARIPMTERLGISVASSAGAETGKGSPYLRHVALLAVRNLLFAFGVIALTLGMAGLWTRPGWDLRLPSNSWRTLPFEADRGTTYLVLVEGTRNADAELMLAASDGSGSVVSHKMFLSGGGSPWDTAVFRMTGRVQPKMMIRAGAGSFRAVLVRRPVKVLGYLGAEALFFLAAFFFHELRRRLPQPRGTTGNTALAFGRGLLAAAFTVSALSVFCAFWYLGIKVLDRVFHFGIWITYDHFIQDFIGRILK